MSLSVLSVVGARPNFMKLAPVARALAARGARHAVVHTGQHYDPEMSEAFFRDLGLPRADHALEVGSGSHAKQTALIMERFEPLCETLAPDFVLVYGDVNSTVAAALVAAKLGVTVGHVEAGLRSRDRTMPEELNRLVLVAALPAARALEAPRKHGVAQGRYTVVTLHRPANVDDPATLCELLGAMGQVSKDGPLLFPVHPRTRARMRTMGTDVAAMNGVRLLEPLPYLEMLGLVSDAGLVITDSGGLQEETTWLGIPCVTVRPNTERPITCVAGTNRLVAPQRGAIQDAARAAVAQRPATPPVIDRWDGHTGERIAAVLCDGARFD